ncbi:MAG: dihydroxy-acid dehydratase, partial [Pseudomonadota bacterium]
IDEKAIVNGVVGLHATGGSTNHTMHLVAIAATAGIKLTWDDISELSDVVPLLARVYPNGKADVNHFQAAGGLAFLIRELLSDGYLHQDVKTVYGTDLSGYTVEAKLDENGDLLREDAPAVSGDETVLAPLSKAFQPTGGLKMLSGNLGKAVIKVSAVAKERHVIEAPARVFHSQDAFLDAFNKKELKGDVAAVVRFQGPKAIGMPELHKLTPCLGILQDKGYKVALITDGRMSGASGKVPAAIHVTPEAENGGPIAKIRDGDMIRIDAISGELQVLVDEQEFAARPVAVADLSEHQSGVGRDLFTAFRANVGTADSGAHVFGA